MNARTIALFPVLALALPLAACKDDPAPPPPEKSAARAEGDVKGGSISDAMIPQETLTSKSPAAKIDPQESAQGDRANPAARATPAAASEPDTDTPPAAPAAAQATPAAPAAPQPAAEPATD